MRDLLESIDVHSNKDPYVLRLIERHPRLFWGELPIIRSDLPPGWFVLVDRLCSDIDTLLSDEQAEHFSVCQVKEKFHGLRFYWGFGRERVERYDTVLERGSWPILPTRPEWLTLEARIYDLIEKAYEASVATCEICGEPGNVQMHVHRR